MHRAKYSPVKLEGLSLLHAPMLLISLWNIFSVFMSYSILTFRVHCFTDLHSKLQNDSYCRYAINCIMWMGHIAACTDHNNTAHSTGQILHDMCIPTWPKSQWLIMFSQGSRFGKTLCSPTWDGTGPMSTILVEKLPAKVWPNRKHATDLVRNIGMLLQMGLWGWAILSIPQCYQIAIWRIWGAVDSKSCETRQYAVLILTNFSRTGCNMS